MSVYQGINASFSEISGYVLINDPTVSQNSTIMIIFCLNSKVVQNQITQVTVEVQNMLTFAMFKYWNGHCDVFHASLVTF